MTCLHAPGQGKVPDREGGPLLRPEGVGAIWPESRLFRAFFVLQQEVGVLYAGAQHGVRGSTVAPFASNDCPPLACRRHGSYTPAAGADIGVT